MSLLLHPALILAPDLEDLPAGSLLPDANNVVISYRSQQLAVLGKSQGADDVRMPQPGCSQSSQRPVRQRITVDIDDWLFSRQLGKQELR